MFSVNSKHHAARRIAAAKTTLLIIMTTLTLWRPLLPWVQL